MKKSAKFFFVDFFVIEIQFFCIQKRNYFSNNQKKLPKLTSSKIQKVISGSEVSVFDIRIIEITPAPTILANANSKNNISFNSKSPNKRILMKKAKRNILYECMLINLKKLL